MTVDPVTGLTTLVGPLTDSNGVYGIGFQPEPLAPVPLPQALPLFATGLGALGLAGRCRPRCGMDPA